MSRNEHQSGAEAGREAGSLAEERGERAEYARGLGSALRGADQRLGGEEGLVARLLAATRAELAGQAGMHGIRSADPSWRGDLTLVRRYLGERLAQSPLLRLAAASLLVHLIAVPAVLAYVYLEKRQPELLLGFEPAPDPQPFEEALPEVSEALEVPEMLDLDGESPMSAANARAWDRAQLLEAWGAGQPAKAAPSVAPLDSAGELQSWLALRGRQLAAAAGEGTWEAAVPAAGPAAGLPSGALALLVAVEAGLDRLALGQPAPGYLADGLAALAAAPLPGAPGSRLAQRALARARAYGLLHGPQGPHADRLAPFDAAWFEDLRAVAAELGVPGADRLRALLR